MSHADLRLSDKWVWIPVQVPANVYLCTEPGVGLTVNILRGIGLEDGLILVIPECDWSSLLLEIVSRLWG